jgi:hypothetical protein
MGGLRVDSFPSPEIEAKPFYLKEAADLPK